jgi:hypothetical protein
MSIVKTLALGLLTVAVFVSTYALRQYSLTRSQHPPFTVQMMELNRIVDSGAVIHTRQYLYAVRGDGSRVYANVVHSEDGSVRILGRNVKLATEGRTMIVDEGARLVSTFVNKGRFPFSGHVSNGQCVIPQGYSQIAEKEVLGYRVIGVRKEDSVAISVKWLATSLDCFILESRTEYKNDDSTTRLIVEKRPTSVTIGEPQATLFEVGSHYTEIPPSGLFGQSERVDAKNPNGLGQKLQNLDAAYDASRPIARAPDVDTKANPRR